MTPLSKDDANLALCHSVNERSLPARFAVRSPDGRRFVDRFRYDIARMRDNSSGVFRYRPPNALCVLSLDASKSDIPFLRSIKPATQ
ncbi:hypothetical protein [Rhodovulum sp. PH10]|uniref:hypothetical protein n=1 Tax=Rhodovulum sp. PH10 TaxID=1187851 RepID=UPI0012FCC07F|nr:hypothetical protein [Rhodovulum sp. PH10]